MRRWRPGVAVLALPGVVFLLAFLVWPVAQILGLSLQDADTAEFTLAAYERAFGRGAYLRVLGNTFVIAGQTTALCLLLGCPLAYWLARLPGRWQRLAVLAVMLPFWTSALVKSFAWLVLLGRNGVVAAGLSALGWETPPELLFSRGTVLFGMVHAMLPLAVLTMLPVMLQIDAALSRAAGTLGAPPAQAFWRVFFHLSLPGLAAAGLLVFIVSLGFFITPALLGSPRETMLGQLIITQIQTLSNWEFGAALAVLLAGAALLSCLAYDRVFGLTGLAGRAPSGGAPDRLLRRAGLVLLTGIADAAGWASEALARRLGGRRFRWVLPAYGVAMLALLMLPGFALVPMGFTSGAYLSFPPPGYGLRWMAEYFGSEVWVGATLRSFGVALATGLAATCVGGLAAYGLARSSGRLARLALPIFLLPMVVPHIVIALALFALFADLGLVATDAGLVIGHAVTALPIVFITLLTTLKGYDWRLDQAAATLGASRPRVLALVTLPLVKGGVLAAFLFAFIHSFEELTIAIFIGGGLKTTLPKQMWDDALLQVNPTLAAASAVVLAIVTILFLPAELLRRRR